MIIEILTAATAGSTIVLGLDINASRAQVRGLAKELNRKTLQYAKQSTRLLDLQAEARAEKDKAKTWEGRATIAEQDLKAALDQLFKLTEADMRRKEMTRIRKARHRAKKKGMGK